MPVIDGKPCARCDLLTDLALKGLCEHCQRVVLSEAMLQAALRKLAEDRAQQAIWIIEDALERLRP